LILRGQFTPNAQQTEWCERRLLARIHRYTVGILRKEIEPVTAAQYMRWLLKWQHLTKDSHVHGEQGLLAIIKQLQGFEISANAWEKHIFAKRMTDYHPDLLDRLCLSGTIGWGRLSTHPATLSNAKKDIVIKKSIIPTSIVPITFFIREECDWLPARKSEFNESGLTELAKEVFAYLKKHGALFFSDIVKSIGRLKLEIENALWELVAAGLITADGFDNLRALIDVRRRLDKRRRLLSLRYSTGRWSILHVPESFDTQKQIEGACWMLLNRYGIVFRDLIMREKNIPSWRELLFTFRRMEDRGEIRGGRFVSGFLGEQFALSYAVDSLRLIKKEVQTDEVLTLSGVDPLNLIGIILPGDKVSAHTKKTLLLKNGSQWV
jgi:ATP-dependent Lhr-like helicase